jgi:uncharacterized protein
MAEKIVSPGVFTQENDLSFLPAGIGEIGAAVVGPTVKGPAMVPTIVNSYSEYVQKFGEIVESGSTNYQYLTSHAAKEYLKYGNQLLVTRILSGSYLDASASIGQNDLTGSSFVLHTIADGAGMNSSGSIGTNSLLANGTSDNLRWEITSLNEDKGTFSLLIRRGNDTSKRKIILETWSNLSLDPSTTNYIGRVIGDTDMTFEQNSGDPYVGVSGNYPNKSAYVRISDIADTLNYLDENGETGSATPSGSLPAEGSGSVLAGAFSGGHNGTVINPITFYENITATNAQGYNPNNNQNYLDAIALLGNQDEYDINLLMTPGAFYSGALSNAAVQMCEDRGDCFYLIDPTVHDASISTATGVSSLDTSYAAAYWPWVQIVDSATNMYRWVPASVVMGGVIAFNDKVSYEWYAPAGLNRGGIETAVRAERKLTHSNRDDLYEKSVNPLATFPGAGVVCWGQKTLQKKASALDRVNVRRLLIKLKKFIASTSRYLVFEQNTTATRNKFLNIVNPYMEMIQQNQGLYQFKVVMDETNNTSDVVDRNIMKGEIYLQPAKTAEFIVVDFNVMPTGAQFNA